MNPQLAGNGDIEITRAQNRNYILGEGATVRSSPPTSGSSGPAGAAILPFVCCNNAPPAALSVNPGSTRPEAPALAQSPRTRNMGLFPSGPHGKTCQVCTSEPLSAAETAIRVIVTAEV
jgi:hypothetical protein